MHHFHQAHRKSASTLAAVEPLEMRSLLSATLGVTVIGPVPASVTAGATVNDTIAVQLTNNGAARISGATTVKLYAARDGKDTLLGTVTKTVHLAAGGSKDLDVAVAAFPKKLSGHYFLLADVVAPAQSASGVSTTQVDVVRPHVDLANQIVSVPTTAQLGSTFNVKLDVTNLGTKTAAGTLGTLFEMSTSSNGSNPFQIATITAPIDIKPGATKKLTLTVPVALGSPTGKEFIVAVLDPTDAFSDPDLTNNTAVSLKQVDFT
jgi:hypothetical protein